MRFIGHSHIPPFVMSRDVPDVVVFALVVVVTVSVVALPASALGGATTPATATTADGGVAPQTTNDSANESETLAPGQRLAGVVGVQGAEIDGELEERTLATRVDRAESNTSKAGVVATALNTARERLRNLRETQIALREARRAGDISTGEYRARMAITAAQIRTVRTQLDSSEAVTRDLPDAALEARGVNREEIDRLREDADDLRGPEVAKIARQVAGNGERGPPEDAGNGERGPPEDAGNGERGPPEDAGNGERGPPEDAGNGERGPPEDADKGNGDAGSGNRSETAGPPAEAEDDEEGDDSDDSPGNSGDAGNDDSDDSPGNSGDAGNDDSDDSPGNSGDAGNDDSDDSPGNSGDAGNGDGSSGGGNDGGSDDAGNGDGSDGAGNGDGSSGGGNGGGSGGGGNGDGGSGNSGGQGGGNR